MAYRVTDAHPVPIDASKGRKTKYPFSTMKPGDSFTVDETEKMSARRAAHQFAARHGQRFTTRGSRIWRVS